MNDLSCVSSVATSPDYRLKTNLYIVLDSSWPYQAVYPAIAYLVDSIEVDKFGSSITLLNAFDGSVVVNTTFSQVEFHSNYTLAAHQSSEYERKNCDFNCLFYLSVIEPTTKNIYLISLLFQCSME